VEDHKKKNKSEFEERERDTKASTAPIYKYAKLNLTYISVIFIGKKNGVVLIIILYTLI